MYSRYTYRDTLTETSSLIYRFERIQKQQGEFILPVSFIAFKAYKQISVNEIQNNDKTD